MQPHAGRALQPNSGGFVQIVSRAASILAPAAPNRAGARSRRPARTENTSRTASQRKGTIMTRPVQNGAGQVRPNRHQQQRRGACPECIDKSPTSNRRDEPGRQSGAHKKDQPDGHIRQEELSHDMLDRENGNRDGIGRLGVIIARALQSGRASGTREFAFHQHRLARARIHKLFVGSQKMIPAFPGVPPEKYGDHQAGQEQAAAAVDQPPFAGAKGAHGAVP